MNIIRFLLTPLVRIAFLVNSITAKIITFFIAKGVTKMVRRKGKKKVLKKKSK